MPAVVGAGVGNAVWGANVGWKDGAHVGEKVGVPDSGPHLASAKAFTNSY
jgi:alkaline phosphatase